MAPGKIVRFTAADAVARTLARKSRPFHWEGPDIEVRIRPRTGTESMLMQDEREKIAADIAAYAGTPDAVSTLDGYRFRLRHTLPCVLDPETKEPLFSEADIDALLELSIPALNEILDEVDRASAYGKAEAEGAEKNSGGTGDASSSSTSPATAATSPSSPTPTPSTGS